MAIHSPNTGIVDYTVLTRSYAEDFKEAGGHIYTGFEVSCGLLKKLDCGKKFNKIMIISILQMNRFTTQTIPGMYMYINLVHVTMVTDQLCVLKGTKDVAVGILAVDKVESCLI